MKKLWIFSTILALSACANTTPIVASSQAMGTWKEVGLIQNNNISVSYDTGSIKTEGNLGNIRERKIVMRTENMQYQDLPEYKTAISEWEFHCTQRTYRLKNMQFWDKNGQELMQYTYNMHHIPAMPIVHNTPTERLFDVACKK